MPVTREEVTESFEAVGSNGATYTVHKVQTYVQVQTTTRTGWGRGSSRYELSSGEHVTQKSGSRFEIVWRNRAENELVTRVE